MEKKLKFDEKIKEMLISGDETCLANFEKPKKNDFGRKLPRWGYRDTYFNEEFGNKIFDSVKDILPKSYQGDELKYKFYSVASSSRFTIASFSEIDGNRYKKINKIGEIKLKNIEFEKDCPIKSVSTGTAPQLDVAFTDGNDIKWYIEVKCHEIFDSHKSLELKSKYLEMINICMKPNLAKLNISQMFILKETESNGKVEKEELLAAQENSSLRLLKSEDFGVERKTTHFDFKQFLCHLMGIISTDIDEKKSKRKLKHFYYLFYKIQDKSFKEIYNELEDEIKVISDVFKGVFKEYNIDFGYCYNGQFSTLKSLKNELKNPK